MESEAVRQKQMFSGNILKEQCGTGGHLGVPLYVIGEQPQQDLLSPLPMHQPRLSSPCQGSTHFFIHMYNTDPYIRVVDLFIPFFLPLCPGVILPFQAGLVSSKLRHGQSSPGHFSERWGSTLGCPLGARENLPKQRNNCLSRSSSDRS